MRAGTGEATVAVAPDAAFAYLADPRHAQEWFAGARLAEPPEGAPHAGMTWRFIQVRSDNRVIPVRMEVYEPPSRFVWRTTFRWPRTNLRWEMRCEPDSGDEEHVTRLRMTIGIEPGPVGWLGLYLSPRLYRPDPAMQAQRAVERAREALLERTTLPTTERPLARNPSEKRGRRRR